MCQCLVIIDLSINTRCYHHRPCQAGDIYSGCHQHSSHISSSITTSIINKTGYLRLSVLGVHCFYGTCLYFQDHRFNVIQLQDTFNSIHFSVKQNFYHLYLTISVSGHPRFFNQLSCGLDVTSLAGEWLTAAANTNMFTYEIAPVFILMEHEVLKKMREIIG